MSEGVRKVLVTGAKGFVGKNLIAEIRARGLAEVYEYDLDTPEDKLSQFCADCDFVYHLAGVNRPKDEAEFMAGNFGFTDTLLRTLKQRNNRAPVLITSSVQAALDNPYGASKRAGEDLIFNYGRENGVKTLVYRLPNLFGKWCRPNYNSAVATFCHNISHELPITVTDSNHKLTLAYIDDVVAEFLRAQDGRENREGEFCKVPVSHEATLGEIVDLLYSFKESRKTKMVPDMTEGSLSKKLYSTYLSYLEPNDFAYPLKMNRDDRGSFTELLRTADRGQFSVNVSKPGITKGQHWHHTKNEKFVVVSGRGLIQLRRIGTDEIVSIEVSGEEMTVVDMIPGYTHNIINLSETDDLVTFMWANEPFDPDKPDTYYEEV